MPINQRYLIIKEKDSKEIKYFEYDKINGYGIKPGTKIRDAINVDKMILINPTLISKMIDKKINRKFKQLLKLLMVIYETDDDTGTGYREALNEISKLRTEVNNKYLSYIEKEKYIIFKKKLDLLEVDLKQRIEILTNARISSSENKRAR